MEWLELVGPVVKSLGVMRWLFSFFGSDEQKGEILAFQGRMVAPEIGMRRVVAWSQNGDRDVRQSIADMAQRLKENSDQAAKGIRQTYPEYDDEMAKTLVRHIAESLESFLPIRMKGTLETQVGGKATLQPE